MFLLHGIYHYESSDVLGVFSSYDNARAALDQRLVLVAEDLLAKVYDLTDYDDYSITEFIVDDTHSALN